MGSELSLYDPALFGVLCQREGYFRMKLIIDTDPGVDDAMAYFYAQAHEQIDLIALTTIFGNVTIADGTRNALWLGEISGTREPVYQGHAVPLEIEPNPPADFVHGKHGFGDYKIGATDRQAETEDAADFLVRAARAAPGEITLCAIGPLTNVARAIQQDRDFVANLAQLVIMGGALDAAGNVGPYAEANFWNDPHAADIVVNAPGAGRIIIVGLDVTSQIECLAKDFDTLAEASPIAGAFLRQIAQFYMDFYKTKTGRLSCHLHDPSAVIACVRPDLMEMEEAALSVLTKGEEIGNLVRREGEGRKCLVCMGVQADALLDEFRRTVALNP